jgi:GT2 family glycosyltransferase
MAEASLHHSSGGGPSLSIVIPVFDHLDLTRDCLDGIRKHTDVEHEIIVVDNGSTDGTAGFLRDSQVRTVTNQENLGFPKAVNQGVMAAGGEFVCLLNNDVKVQEHWLEPLLEAISTDRRAGVAGPLQVGTGGTVWHAGTAFGPDDHPTLARRPFHIFMGYSQDDPLIGQPREYPAMNFGCCLIRNSIFEEIGLLDDETFVFPGIYEDVDWCLRARKAGYRCLYRPDSRVLHDASQTQRCSGDDLASASLKAAELNLDRLISKWKNEPESFLVPEDLRPLLDDYFVSAPFLRKENQDLKDQLSVLFAHMTDLETKLSELAAVNAEGAAYVRKVENDWKEKCEQLAEAEARAAHMADLLAAAAQPEGKQPGKRNRKSDPTGPA